MEIRKKIQYSAEDLQLGYTLHLNKNYPFRSKLLLFMGLLLMIMGVLLVILQSIAGNLNWLSFSFIVYGIAILIYYKWKLKAMGKAAYKKLTNFHHPFDFTISEEKVITSGKNTTSESAWEHYEFAVISEKILLLYPNKLTFVIFPRKYFSDTEYGQIKSWIEQKVKCK